MSFNLLRMGTLLASSGLLAMASPAHMGKRETSSSSSTTSTSADVTALMATVISGTPTTIEVPLATAVSNSTDTGAAKATGSVSQTGDSATQTGSSLSTSKNYPVCQNGDPFCLPTNEQDVYVGETYLVTWDTTKFTSKSNVTIKIHYYNESAIEAYSSDALPSTQGYTTIQMQNEWLQTYARYNLTFYLLNTQVGGQVDPYDGPHVSLINKPPRHYPPSEHNKVNKEGLVIGLPVALGVMVLIIVALFFGMRKHRTIGLGNIMGRKRGYGTRKSRRQRMGLGKKGAIHLREVEVSPDQQYRDHISPAPRGHSRQESLGSLVNSIDDDQRNVFRDEISRQTTGRR